MNKRYAGDKARSFSELMANSRIIERVNLGKKEKVYDLGIGPTKALDCFPEQYTIDPSIPEEEQKLFTWLNIVSQKRTAKAIDSLASENTPITDHDRLIARVTALKHTNSSIKKSGRFMFAANLYERAQEQRTAIGESAYHAIDKMTDDLLSVDIRESGGYFEYNYSSSIPEIESAISSLSGTARKLAEDEFIDFRETIKRYEHVLSKLAVNSSGILDLWSRNEFVHKEPVFDSEEDTEAFKDILGWAVADYIRTNSATSALDLRYEFLYAYCHNAVAEYINRAKEYEKTLVAVPEPLQPSKSKQRVLESQSFPEVLLHEKVSYDGTQRCIDWGTPAKELSEKFPTLFIEGEHLSPEEAQLIKTLNENAQKIIDAQTANQDDWAQLKLRANAFHALNITIAKAPTVHFFQQLAIDCEQKFSEGAIDQATYETVKALHQQHCKVALSEGESYFEYNFVDKTDIPKIISHLTGEARVIADRLLEQNKIEAARYTHIIRELGAGTGGIIDCWSRNNFVHTTPLLVSEADVEIFKRNLIFSLKENIQVIDHMTTNSLQDDDLDYISKAVDQFVSRVQEYEKPMVVAQKKIEDERTEKHRQFMATPQHYKLGSSAKEDFESLFRAHKAISTDARNAAALATAVNVIDRTRMSLDTRGETDVDGSVVKLGNLLLSSNNLKAVTDALDVGGAISGGKPSNGIAVAKNSAAEIREACALSPKSHEIVDSLLADETKIISVATLLLGTERASKYASQMLKTQKNIIDLRNSIPFDDDEIRELSDEPDVQKWANEKDKIKNDCAVLAGEIREVMHGGRRNRIRNGTSGYNHGKTPDLDKTVMELMGTDIRAAVDPDDVHKCRYISVDFPEMRSELVKITAGKTTHEAAIEELRTRSKLYSETLYSMRELGSSCGFELAPDGRTLLHRGFDISVPWGMSDRQQQLELLHYAENEWRQKKTLLDLAKAHQIAVEGIDEKGIITGKVLLHYAGETIEVGATHRLEENDIKRIQAFIDWSATQKAAQPAITKCAETNIIADNTDVSWLPHKEESLFIFDATPLISLSATRNGSGRTWHDLVRCAAGENIKAIVPAVVADWELRGEAPVYDKENHIISFEKMAKRSPEALAAGAFLNTATRARLHEDGSITITSGNNTNPDIIVLETEGDKAFYDDMRSHGPANINRFHGNGEGEAAINRILNAKSLPGRAMIISDDTKYLGDTNPHAKITPIEGQILAPHSTACGQPVGHVGTYTFLTAIAMTCENRLKAKYNIVRNGRPLYVDVISSVAGYWNGRVHLSNQNTRGIHGPESDVAIPLCDIGEILSDREWRLKQQSSSSLGGGERPRENDPPDKKFRRAPIMPRGLYSSLEREERLLG